MDEELDLSNTDNKDSQNFQDSLEFDDACTKNMELKSDLRVTDKSFMGLNGIINMGNTCYLSSIVQVLLHTPDIRNYFLMRRLDCAVSNSHECLVCEMFSIFQKFYNDRTMPIKLSRLLYIIWKNQKTLSSNDQQDAHELLVNFRDIFHLHSKGSRIVDRCTCIIDLTYTGYLQTTMQCKQCRRSSRNQERFMDISLSLNDPIYDQVSKKRKSQRVTSLENCLNKFVAPELIEDRLCEYCNKRKGCIKFWRFKTLPRVLTFHLKRWNCSKKDNTLVTFPETLDMTPYLTNEKCDASDGKESLDNLEYKLFGVVNHKGSVSGGHFVAYVKHNLKNWFQCNDEVIEASSFQQIVKLSDDAYILFYHK